MKTLITAFYLLASLQLASALDFRENAQFAEIDHRAELLENFDTFEFKSSSRETFKRRHIPLKGYKLALSIKTNFDVPVVGVDQYFGYIYLKEGSSQIKYRDELIAERRYEEESKNPQTFYMSGYDVADINSPGGLKLLDSTGASVSLKSLHQKFSTSQGGVLLLKVKHPMDGSFSLHINFKISKTDLKSYVIQDGKQYAFDTIKINAGSLGIAISIKNIEFISNNKIVFTYK